MFKPLILTALTVVLLSGCSDQSGSRHGKASTGNLFSSYGNLEALRQSANTGSEFADSLRANYLTFATREVEHNWDFVSADIFARKGLMATQGVEVLPEVPNHWRIASGKKSEIARERQRLIKLLDAGARARHGNLAGTTQVMYDCWVEEEAEGYQPDDIAACRGRYLALIAELESAMRPPAQISATPEQNASLVMEERTFVVNFDFDKSVVRPSELPTLQKIAAAYAANRTVRIDLAGHTDTAGSESYNLILSRERAVSIANNLAKLGVDRQQIWMSWHGEKDLAVPTANNVREERNRRVMIAIN